MLNDNYYIKSSIHKNRSGVRQNIRTFLQFFNDFYDKLRVDKHPNFYHEMSDPYGFALLCQDYADKNIKYDMDLTCEEIFNKEATVDHMDYTTYHGQFSFKELLSILYRGYWFDYDKALAIYQNQHDAFHIFNQILNGSGYIFNRYNTHLKHAQQAIKYATQSIITLNEDLPIQTPHIWRLCDGMVAPFIVMKHNRDIKVKKCDCHGFGDGLFVISNNHIIDVLRINDTWFDDLPLENRLKFAYKCTEYPIAGYIKAWSWRSILQAGQLLKANSTNGLLVRGCRDDFYNNRWFNWSKTSLIYCYNKQGQLVAHSRGRNKPDFYTLEGDLGVISPFEERKIERVFLDDFDIREFQKILELKYDGD